MSIYHSASLPRLTQHEEGQMARARISQASWGRFFGHWAIVSTLCVLQFNPVYSFTHEVLYNDSVGLRSLYLFLTTIVVGALLWRVWRLHSYNIPRWTYGVGLFLLMLFTGMWWQGIIVWENGVHGWMSFLIATLAFALWSYGPALHARLAAIHRRYEGPQRGI